VISDLGNDFGNFFEVDKSHLIFFLITIEETRKTASNTGEKGQIASFWAELKKITLFFNPKFP
jgi:hypothetical protein